MGLRVAGSIEVKTDGSILEAKGQWSYNLGHPKREPIYGANLKVIGYKETAQEPYIEGEIQDSEALDVAAIVQMKDKTVTLSLQNGKTISLKNAFYSGDGTVTCEEGTVPVKFTGTDAEEIV